MPVQLTYTNSTITEIAIKRIATVFQARQTIRVTRSAQIPMEAEFIYKRLRYSSKNNGGSPNPQIKLRVAGRE